MFVYLLYVEWWLVLEKIGLFDDVCMCVELCFCCSDCLCGEIDCLYWLVGLCELVGFLCVVVVGN